MQSAVVLNLFIEKQEGGPRVKASILAPQRSGFPQASITLQQLVIKYPLYFMLL